MNVRSSFALNCLILLMGSPGESAWAEPLASKLTVKERVVVGNSIEFVANSETLFNIRIEKKVEGAVREYVRPGKRIDDRFTVIEGSHRVIARFDKRLKILRDIMVVDVKDETTGVELELWKGIPVALPPYSIDLVYKQKGRAEFTVKANSHFRVDEEENIDADTSMPDGQWYRLMQMSDYEVLVVPCDKAGEIREGAARIPVAYEKD